MSNYTKATDFAIKDGLPSGDPAKVIKGTEFETEFDAIATAVNSKSDTASPTFTGTVTTTAIAMGNWTIKLDTNELIFEYNGTDVFKLGTNGAVTSADNVTAYGTV